MGLLDQMFGGDPGSQALTATALSLIGAKGKNTGEAFGRAGLLGMGAYNNARENQSQQKERDYMARYREQQMMQAQAEIEQKQQQQAKLASYRASLPPQDQGIFDIAPQEYIKNMPQFQKPQLVEVADPNEPLRTMKQWMRPGDTQGTVAGYGAMPESLDPRIQDAKMRVAAAGRSTNAPAPYYQFISTPQGIVAANARDGTVSVTDVNGRPVIKASDSPSLQGEIAGAKKSGQVIGESTATAQIDLPRSIASADEAVRLTDELLAHPGLSQAVGGSSMLGIQNIPGTQAKDFMVRLDQLKGKQFLEAFQSLKGGGQITEVEGKKATDAIARMDNASSEEAFKQATRDFQSVIRRGLERAKEKAGASPIKRPVTAPTFLGFE